MAVPFNQMEKNWHKPICLKGGEWWGPKGKSSVLDVLSFCKDTIRNISGDIWVVLYASPLLKWLSTIVKVQKSGLDKE